MAWLRILVAIAIVAAVVAPSLATEFMVGNDKGWTINFDYKAWAADKEFHVGDKLIFKYPEGGHDVHKVDLAAFQQCAPPETSVALKTGNDVISLATPGTKWYVCSVGSHCVSGNQKLAITVFDKVGSPAAASPSPTTNPTSAAKGFAPSTYFSLMIAAMAVFKMIMV